MKHSLRATSLRLLLLVPVAACMAADDVPAPAAPGGITEIVLEQTWCYGACPVDRLVLRADGTAEYTGIENTPRTGQFTGRFHAAGFEQLARWLVSEGFFELKDSYGSNNVDAPSQVIRVTRGGQRKSVVSYSMERSLKLWGMASLVGSVSAGIQWQPAVSGVRGRATVGPPGGEARPLSTSALAITPESQGFTPSGTRERFSIRTDQDGRFEIPLAPGRYSVDARTGAGAPLVIVVEPGRFGEAALRFEAPVVGSTARSVSELAELPPPPGDGVYRYALLTPAKWLYQQGTQTIRLGDRTEFVVNDRRLWSDSKDDSAFLLGLAVPYDATVNTVSHVLVVGGNAYRMGGAGTRAREASFLYFRIAGEQGARAVAQYFNTPVHYFRDPGYQMSLSITPAKPVFRRGETVTALIRITNTGTRAIEFNDVFPPSARNDELTFTARRNGQVVPDISFAGERSGAELPSILSPGTTFEDRIDLGRWFQFTQAGPYEIHGSYRMHLKDSKSGAWMSITWPEHAQTDFVVAIE